MPRHCHLLCERYREAPPKKTLCFLSLFHLLRGVQLFFRFYVNFLVFLSFLGLVFFCWSSFLPSFFLSFSCSFGFMPAALVLANPFHSSSGSAHFASSSYHPCPSSNGLFTLMCITVLALVFALFLLSLPVRSLCRQVVIFPLCSCLSS